MEQVVENKKSGFDKYKIKKLIITLLPLLALILLFVAYIVILNINDYNVMMNLKTFPSQI